MRFLILGASGMAGHVIALYLKNCGHEVIGYSRRVLSYIEFIKGDARDTKKITKLIQTGNFDSIINVIGILNQFAEKNKETAVFINSYLPHFLVQATQNLDTQLIHISTDCVFSGKNGPYVENSLRDGMTFYDRTKALGEIEDSKNLTLRTSIVGPDINANGIGLFNWFMKQEKEVNGYIHAMWTGMTTLQLAKTIEAAAKEKANGLVNMVGTKNISKFELLCLFNKYFRNNKIVIRPDDSFSINKTLIRNNFDFNYCVPDYDSMIAEMAEWIQCYKNLYPHYLLV